MTDPWSVQGADELKQDNSTNESSTYNTHIADQISSTQILEFEDSFIQQNTSIGSLKSNSNILLESLPDSVTYLQGLERKLEKLKKGSKLIDALSEKREDCLRSMLQNNSCNSQSNDLLELELSITNSDSAVQNLFRQIQPVQPVTIGETVHIVKYDQLEEQRLETESEDSDHLPASR